MSRTPIEEQLTRRLHRLADFAPAAADRTPNEALASTAAPMPSTSRRRWAPAWALGLATAIVLGAVIVSHLTGGTQTQRAGTTPHGRAQHVLTIAALPVLTFGDPLTGEPRTEFFAQPGITTLRFVSLGGSETLVFDEPALSDVRLSAPGGPSQVNLLLERGRTYTIASSIPGHRRAGMEATITVR
ncbi:MAG: hypothetical protein JJE46_03045 [Acidimicrobiia bacterium]|nr:hypothetical protein [Acidimicrobiia bacterium]